MSARARVCEMTLEIPKRPCLVALLYMIILHVFFIFFTEIVAEIPLENCNLPFLSCFKMKLFLCCLSGHRN